MLYFQYQFLKIYLSYLNSHNSVYIIVALDFKNYPHVVTFSYWSHKRILKSLDMSILLCISTVAGLDFDIDIIQLLVLGEEHFLWRSFSLA